MRRRNLMVFLAVVFAIAVGTAYIEQAPAAGYWNVPGTVAQCMGHGYGGGYHAPLILGPIRCDCWGLGTPVRLRCAPSPYYGYGSCGGGECGRLVEATSSMESVVPTIAPTQAPRPTAATPIETRTVEPAESAQATTSESAVQDPEPEIAPPAEQIVEPLRPLFDPPVQH
jgi:hypothetical protein